MRRRKFITLTTEQDIEDACEYMDRRERDALQELGTGAPNPTMMSALWCCRRARAFSTTVGSDVEVLTQVLRNCDIPPTTRLAHRVKVRAAAHQTEDIEWTTNLECSHPSRPSLDKSVAGAARSRRHA